MGDFRGCRAGVSVRHGITSRLGPFFGTFRPQSQSHICTIFEEVLVARAQGIGAIAFRSSTPIREKLAHAAVLLFAEVLLVILAHSGADYAGVRHALSVYIVLAILGGCDPVARAGPHKSCWFRRPLSFSGRLLSHSYRGESLGVPQHPRRGTGQAYGYFCNDEPTL